MKTLRFSFLFFCLFFLQGLAGQAQFGVSPAKGCAPLTVNFTDQSTGAVQWDWDFGNGNKSTLQNPSAIYYASGRFTVTLTIWDASGNKSTIIKTNHIRVFKKPTADFSISKLISCAGSAITLKDLSILGDTTIVKYSWDMGDGTIINSANPTHTYGAKGTYNISLVVTDANGCQDKIQKNAAITIKESPKASFVIDSAYNCRAPSKVYFTDKSTGGSLTYSWNFGDGNTSTQKNPVHTYTNFGYYTPSLTVTDTNGCSATITIPNGVYLGPINVDFSASPTKLCDKGNVNFSLIGNLVPSVKYEWDFGDGNTVTKSFPTNFYAKPGVYTVKLKATSLYRNCSATVEKKQYIRVNAKPKGTISSSDSFPCEAPFDFTLKYTDTAEIESIVWRFVQDNGFFNDNAGEGEELYQYIENYNKRYYSAVVTTKLGCTDTIPFDHPIKSDSVVAKFDRDTSGCAPFSVNFYDRSESDYPIANWEWTFHDGTNEYDKNTNFYYPDTGVFKVRLIVSTKHGCTDSITKLVQAGMKAPPSFSLKNKNRICNNVDTVWFINTTKFPGFNIDSFRWVYDDNNKQTLRKPLSQKSYSSTNVWHRYDRDTGAVTPMLISYHHGCPDTIKKIDTFRVNPPFAKMEFISNPCKGDTLIVKNKSTAFTRHKWIVNDAEVLKDSLILYAQSYYKITLWVWNDTMGCYDTLREEYFPPANTITLCSPKLSSYCTPATLKPCITDPPANKGNYWTLNGTDTIPYPSNRQFKLDTAGEYLLVFHHVLTSKCTRYFSQKVRVWNGKLAGAVTKPTTCLPATIKLIDSGWAPGKPKHAWRMSNGDTVIATAKEMDYVVKGSYLDSLEIFLTNEPNEGLCKPFKRFVIPTSGPGTKLNWAWQNTCSTQTFLGNAEMNPNKGTAPFSFAWNMGDGTTYSTQFVSHKFSDTGWYYVTVTVTDAIGCKVMDYRRIYVPEFRLNIRIAADTSGSACPPLYVNFTDLSTAGGTAIKSWEWDFGDGTYSTQKNPKHQYLFPGRFKVKLKITDAMGCTRTKEFHDFIVITGPYGKYWFDNTSGCYPVSVQFMDSFSTNTFKMEWDFGDGVIGDSYSPKHVYTKPGRYIPAVILTDTVGCKIALPPVDTIFIYDYPVAQYAYTGICLRDSVKIKSTSYATDYPIVKWRWDLEDNIGMLSKEFNYQFGSRNTMVRHIVTSEKGCSDTMDKPIPLKQPTVKYTSEKDTVCLGTIWSAKSDYSLDTALQSLQWTINKQYFSSAEDIQFFANIPGQYWFQLKITDAAGCWDTFAKPHAVTVGDTVIPPTVPILRVSVENDVTHDIKFQKFPTFDFSGYTIFRENGSQYVPVLHVNNRFDTLHFLSGVDALHRSYCYRVSTKNLCGFTQNVAVLKDHCTVEVSGKPAINAALLRWNKYTGWPVKKYIVLREDHKNFGHFDSIGSVDGAVLDYIDSNIVCYVNHVYKIRALEENGFSEISLSDTCHVKPIYINIVPTPEVRRATVENDLFVRLEWDELYKNRQPIDFYEIEKLNKNNAYQWVCNAPAADSFAFHDHKTMVDNESYTYHLRAVDVCGDKSDFSNIGKSILLQTDINEKYRPVLQWSRYQEWKEGVKEYVIEKRNQHGAFAEVSRTAADDTVYTDNLSSLNCIPLFEYRVYAIRNIPVGLPTGTPEIRSYSNVDAPPVVTKVYIPNAFTPNNNALNETFKPQGIYIASYRMLVYNRWGEKMFEGTECDNAWDGNYHGTAAPHGVYIYLVDALGSDGRHYRFQGDVTLLR